MCVGGGEYFESVRECARRISYGQADRQGEMRIFEVFQLKETRRGGGDVGCTWHRYPPSQQGASL